MRKRGGKLEKSSTRRPRNPRRYSPLHRTPGLRHFPNEPIGLAVSSSLILHAALILGLVFLTDAPPENAGADVSSILTDLIAGSPAASVGEPASTPPPGAIVPEPTAVSPSRPAGDGAARLPATSRSADAPEPSVSSAFAQAGLPDADWPEPTSPALIVGTSTQPAKTLTSAPSLQDASRAAPAVIGTAANDAASIPPAPSEGIVVAGTSGTSAELPSTADLTPTPAALTPLAPAGSPFGLNLGRALVRLDAPRSRVTDHSMPTVSGQVVGGAPERLVLYVNGAPANVSWARRNFDAAVPLRPGTNELRAIVTGADGIEAEDTITVQYVPPPSSRGIVLTSPPDGLTLGPDDPPVAIVEGEIDDKTAATVWIVANDRRISVTASGGRFRHVLLMSDPLVHLSAETPGAEAVHRSPAVTGLMAGARPPSGVLVMQWPSGTEESSVEVSATWRAHPERLDLPVQSIRLPAASKTPGGAPSDAFYIGGLKPGVYTLIVRYRGTSSLGDVRPTLYLPDKEQLTPRALKPVALNGTGRRVLTKVLMPQAILWEQEDWFSGRSESVDTVTKFRIPEGISWVERKADLP